MSVPVRFEQAFPVRPEDIDHHGHLNNLVYLRWVQDVATGPRRTGTPS